MPFDDSRMTTRSKKPPMSTITAGLRSAPAAAAAGRRWRVSGQRIPAQTTPTSSKRPQKLSHTWRIGQSQAMKRMRMSSSTASALMSNDSSQAIEPAVAPRRGARRMSAAAAVDAPDARKSAPSHGLSAQIGRFVTVRRTPVYPATKKPSSPPTAATSLVNVLGALLRQERNAQAANRRIAHAPNEIGEKPLNMRCGKLSDWNSMCQKRKGLPRSKVSSAPEMTAPQNASEYAVRMTGRSSGRPNHSRVAARKYAPPARPPTKKYGMMNHVQCGDAVKKVS